MKNFSGKKGVTLAEISIVLAVIAIMSTMVVSFSMACNLWVQQGINRQNTLSAFDTVKNGIKSFVSDFDDEDHVFFVDGTSLCVRDIHSPDSLPYYIAYSDGALKGSSPRGSIAYPAENITAVSFSVVAGSGGNSLIVCTVDYAVPPVNENRNPETGSYKVAVAPRVAAAEVL